MLIANETLEGNSSKEIVKNESWLAISIIILFFLALEKYGQSLWLIKI